MQDGGFYLSAGHQSDSQSRGPTVLLLFMSLFPNITIISDWGGITSTVATH